MIIFVLGKTASGKDTIVNHLVDNYDFKRIVTWTSRPMRVGEVQGVNYNYTSREDFENKINEEFFAEYREYNTVDGVWYYGTSYESLEMIKEDDKYVLILDPTGFKKIRKNLTVDYKSVYICSSISVISERLKLRGDDTKEAIRRIEADLNDFIGIENLVDKVFYNNENTNINSLSWEIGHCFMLKK